eukprot:6844681-Prymnesium_polylepis.1
MLLPLSLRQPRLGPSALRSPLVHARRIRIYAVDKVPGVSTVAGGQPKQGLSPAAAAGAERLAAA